MNEIFFYVYLLLSILSIFVFTASRCLLKVKTFDMFLYPNENFAILENYWFMAYHIIIYILLGYLFGFEVKYIMLMKILALETYLYAVEYCDIFKVAKVHNLIITIILAILSYLFGCFLGTIKIT